MTEHTLIQARPTLYRGIRMRSRLEADYAAALDRAGYRWEYEPECFASEAGQWLPDFGCTYADGGPYGVFEEVKPAGPLSEHEPASAEFIEHVDAVLRRMTITWVSRPDAFLRLTFWQYGGPPYLSIFSARQGTPWYALGDGPVVLLWLGMGQSERLRSSQSQDETATVPSPVEPSAGRNLSEQWPGLMGPAARHTFPGDLVDGEFTIYADSAAMETQTRLASKRLLVMAKAIFGVDAVNRIRVRRDPFSKGE